MQEAELLDRLDHENIVTLKSVLQPVEHWKTFDDVYCIFELIAKPHVSDGVAEVIGRSVKAGHRAAIGQLGRIGFFNLVRQPLQAGMLCLPTALTALTPSTTLSKVSGEEG